ncbi:hypothetical protein H4582DRAFT_2028314 [Lactarius indigo]|nr:hypothetical protein H4582DRAFT_2028314 [Lactarius indigo]
MRFFLAPLCALLMAALVVASPVRGPWSPFTEPITHSHFIHRSPRRTLSGERLSSKIQTSSALIEELCGCNTHADHVSCRCQPFFDQNTELTITSHQPLLTGPCTVELRDTYYFVLSTMRCVDIIGSVAVFLLGFGLP